MSRTHVTILKCLIENEEFYIHQLILSTLWDTEDSASDPLLTSHKAILQIILASLIMGRTHLSSWYSLASCKPVCQDGPHVTVDLPTLRKHKANNLFSNTDNNQSYFLMFPGCQFVLSFSETCLQALPCTWLGTVFQLVKPPLQCQAHRSAHLLACPHACLRYGSAFVCFPNTGWHFYRMTFAVWNLTHTISHFLKV